MISKDKLTEGPIIPDSESSKEYVEQFELLCNKNWVEADESLGELKNWPFSLRTYVLSIFKSRTPKCILWGSKLIRIYNAEFRIHLAGDGQHPMAMGSSVYDYHLEILQDGETPKAVVDRVLKTGKPYYSQQRLFLKSSKTCSTRKEESYISFDLLPAFDDESNIVGLLAGFNVLTQEVLSNRRGVFLRSLVEAGQDVPTLTRLRVKLQAVLATCGKDWPMFIIYLRADVYEGEYVLPDTGESKTCFRKFVSAGTMNMEKKGRFELADGVGEDSMIRRKAQIAHAQRKTIQFIHGKLDDHCERRAHGMTSQEGRITPVYNHDDGDKLPFAFIFMTFSPVRTIDEVYVDYARATELIMSNMLLHVQRVTTSRARAEQAEHSRQFGQKFFKIVDDSPIGICLQDWATNDVVFANHTFRELFGLPASGDEMLNGWPELIYPDDLAGAFEILSNLKVGDTLRGHRMRLKTLHTNHKPKWINVNCTFHTGVNKTNEIVNYMASAITDISEEVYAQEKEVEVALEKERLQSTQKAHEERANEADRAKARQLEYIDVLSHEIRNPISAIVQTVEVINSSLRTVTCKTCLAQDRNEMRQIIEDLATIEICTTHMSRVINDALNVSRLEHGSLSINVQPCDLLEHIKSILRMLAQEMKNKNIQCPPIEIDKSWSTRVRCVKTDPLRYKQVLLNLLTNAIKFTALKDGMRQISIRLSSRKSDDPGKAILACAITDNGKGMTEQVASRLFGKFEQESARTHVNYGGSGLGLFISQRLANLLGGDLTVSSEVGVGSTFLFSIETEVSDMVCCGNVEGLDKENSDAESLKLALAELGDSRTLFQTVDLPSRESTVSPNEPITPSQTETPPTVLVVEDNLINQRLLVKQLRMEGYNVLVGNHGQEALDHFKAGQHIDLVLTDIEMPVLNGLDFLAAVRSLESKSKAKGKVGLPFIACSAYAREEQKQEFLSAGMCDVIAKPYKFADLKVTVEKTIRSHRALKRHDTY